MRKDLTDVTDESGRQDSPPSRPETGAILPSTVDRAALRAELDELRIRDSAHAEKVMRRPRRL